MAMTHKTYQKTSVLTFTNICEKMAFIRVKVKTNLVIF